MSRRSLVPSPHRLQIRRYAPGGTRDAMGNLQGTYGPPVDWMVRSVDPVTGREPGLENRDAALLAYAIQADNAPEVPGYRDLVVVDGVEYLVDGRPDDWSRGPWPNPAAGVTVYLRRVEG